MEVVESNLGECCLEAMLKEERNNQHKTPLLLAAYLGQVNLFRILIEHQVC